MKKIIVVGGGVAGLTAGIYSLLCGVECTLIEKNKSGAGALCGWRRGEYEVDGCLHWLTGTKEGTELYDLWRTTDVLDGEVVRTDSFFSSETDFGKVSLYDDAMRAREEMIRLAPCDRREIDKFFLALRAASTLSGTEGERSMKKCEALLTLAPYALLNCGELSERFNSPVMKRMLCDLTGKWYSSLGLIFAYSAYTRGNAYLPRGGSRAAAERMVERFKSLGGEYVTCARAERIKRTSGGIEVETTAGVVHGDGVVCCIDPVRASSTLFDENVLPPSFASKIRKCGKYPLFSSVHFAFSAKGDDVPFKGTVFFPCRRQSISSVSRGRMMLREFSHEKGFAPEGMNILQTMFFTNARDSRDWIVLRRSESEYEAAKKHAAAEAKERIAERFPSLSRIDLVDSWTPATFSRYLGSLCGSYMSFALTPATRPASFPTKLPGVGVVRFASMWTRSPGGVPNAAVAGRDAALSLIREES